MAASCGGGDATELTTDQIDHQTRVVFTNFVIEKLEHDDPSQIDLLKTVGLDMKQNRGFAQVGRQLAQIGDDVNERYRQQFEQIANELDMSSDSIYEKFTSIVHSLLRKEANWGQILTLFCFGYYLARRFLSNSSFVDFFTRIQDCVIHFVRNYIAQWIISQGGWLQVATEHLTNSGNRYIYRLSVVGGIAFVLCAIYYLRKKN